MAVQTSYSTTHAKAYAGMVADQQLKNTTSVLNKDVVAIPYGKGVVRGGLLPTSGSTAASFVGVAMRELNRAYADGDTFGIPVGRDGTALTAGVIWVKAANDTIVAGETVHLRVGATNTGDFSNAVGSAGTLSVALNGKFLTGGDTGDLVQISLVIGG